MIVCPICKESEAVTTATLYVSTTEENRIVYTKSTNRTLEFPSCEPCRWRVSRDGNMIEIGWFVPLFFGGLAYASFMNYADLGYPRLIGFVFALVAVVGAIGWYRAYQRRFEYYSAVDFSDY